MSEWWTYSLGDLLMFSPQTYYRLLERYNSDLWPAQIIAIILGIVILVLLHRGGETSARWIAAILSACWLWVAWVFHWQRYAQINLAASYIAWAFVAESLLLLWLGVIRKKILIEETPRLRQQAGMGVFLFALIIHPMVGILFGRSWMQAEIFGLAPDPTALATLGLILIAPLKTFWALAVIPMLWCLTTGVTLWVMESPDFFITPLLAILAIVFSTASGQRDVHITH